MIFFMAMIEQRVINYIRLQYNTIQYNIIQYNAVQYSTVQYDTILSYAIQDSKYSTI